MSCDFLVSAHAPMSLSYPPAQEGHAGYARGTHDTRTKKRRAAGTKNGIRVISV